MRKLDRQPPPKQTRSRHEPIVVKDEGKNNTLPNKTDSEASPLDSYWQKKEPVSLMSPRKKVHPMAGNPALFPPDFKMTGNPKEEESAPLVHPENTGAEQDGPAVDKENSDQYVEDRPTNGIDPNKLEAKSKIDNEKRKQQEGETCSDETECSELDGFVQSIYGKLNSSAQTAEELVVGAKRELNGIEFTHLGQGKYALGDSEIDLGSLLQIVVLVQDFVTENFNNLKELANKGSELKENGLELVIGLDLSGFALNKLDGKAENIGKMLNEIIDKPFGKKGKVSGGVGLKAEVSTEGKLKFFIEAGGSLGFGPKKIADIKAIGAQNQTGIEFDATEGSFDLFNAYGFYFFGVDFEHTGRVFGSSENELNIGVELEAGILSVGIKHKPQPSHLGTTPDEGFATSFRQSRNLAAQRLVLKAKQERKKKIKLQA